MSDPLIAEQDPPPQAPPRRLRWGWLRPRRETAPPLAAEDPNRVLMCTECRYDLSGHRGREIICPECGTVIVTVPAMLAGRLTLEELGVLSRLAGVAAVLNLVGAAALLIVAWALLQARSVPLLLLILAAVPVLVDVALTVVIARIVRIVEEARIRLGRMPTYAWPVVVAKAPSTLAIVVAMSVIAVNDRVVEDWTPFVLFGGVLAALGLLALQARFLEHLAYGAVASNRRRLVHFCAQMNVVIPLITIGLVLCMVGLVLAPFVFLLGACWNAAILSILRRDLWAVAHRGLPSAAG